MPEQLRRIHPGIAVAGVVILAVLVWAVQVWLRPQVRVIEASKGSAAAVVYATGVVEPRYWAKVVALQRKRIVEICQCEGQAVKKGDVLAHLDDLEERAVLRELQARAARLREDLGRIKRLMERNAASKVSFDNKLTALREYEAKVSAQEDRINDLQLRAPMDGVVLRRDGEVGEVAGIGANDVLFWVGQPDQLRVVAEVSEEDIPRVRKGQSVLLRHDGHKGETLQARVDEITPKGDPATKTFRVYFALPSDTPLRIGMSVEANIIVRQVSSALLVPAEAVEGETIMVVVNGRVRQRKVKLGIRGTRMVEVASGLKEKAIVVSPVRKDLKPGTRVKVTLGETK